jgi:hypothetical protein
MSTNREQHELAAKAAGLLLLWKTGSCKGGEVEAAFVGDQPWRPKDDDGDAFRLGVSLGIQSCWSQSMGHAIAFWAPPFKRSIEIAEYGPNPRAATRLAIFRAAVAIGKAMQASTSPHTPT